MLTEATESLPLVEKREEIELYFQVYLEGPP